MEDIILDSITPPPDERAIESNYGAFDEVCEKELKVAWRAKDFANRDLYFYRVETHAKWELADGEISLFEPPAVQLGKLKNKVGIYHIWYDHSPTSTQEDHIFQALYVGKGHLDIRLKEHVAKYLNELGVVFITVQECENRIAKYLEQLFLDTFNFPLNIAENTGVEGCFYTRAKWTSATTGSDGDDKALRHAQKIENDRRK